MLTNGLIVSGAGAVVKVAMFDKGDFPAAL
jgi:hypothetical protein